MTETQLKVIGQIYKAFENLGADIDILSLVGSFGTTQEDDDILEMFEQYNETGSYFAEVFASVSDTPSDRRSRMKLVNENKDR